MTTSICETGHGRISIALYSSTCSTTPRREEKTWPELVQLLSTFRHGDCPVRPCPGLHKCPGKDGAAWSPAILDGKRCNANVRALTVAVFDLDSVRAEQLDEIERGLASTDYAYVIHTTHSHAPPAECCARIAMPLSRPVLPTEWLAFRAAAEEHLGFAADPSTKDASRMYLLPDAPPGNEHFARSRDGAALDVDEVLAASRRVAGSPAATSRPLLDLPPAPDAAPVDLAELRALLLRRTKKNRDEMRAALAGAPWVEGTRNPTLHKLISTCAFVLPLSIAEDSILELFRPVFTATPWDAGDDPFDMARKMLRKARERARRELALRRERNDRARRLLWADATPSELAPLEEGENEPTEWANRLITNQNVTVGDYVSDKPLALKTCDYNIEAILRDAPEWRDVLRLNLVTRDVEFAGSPLPAETTGATLDYRITTWLQGSKYGRLGLMPKPHQVRDALLSVAEQRQFDPIIEEFEARKWDGVSRCETMLERYCRAVGDLKYIRAVSKKFMISLAARALRPGCPVHSVLIFEGGQGIGKSSFFKILGGKWFSDTEMDIHSKDSWANAGKYLLIEFSEMVTIKSAKDVQGLKAFLTKAKDTYRPPYARFSVDVPRRAVFGGSTNKPIFLQNDESGYRRFWPIKCEGDFDLEGLERDREQLLAEAVTLFRKGEQWHLTREEALLAEEQAQAKAEGVNEVIRDAVLDWLNRMAPEARPRAIPLRELMLGALGGLEMRATQNPQRDTIAVLQDLKFGRPKPMDYGESRRRCWTVPQELLDAPQSFEPTFRVAPTQAPAYA
jgi:hypothetical protein